jgi:hypothetical protein
MPQNPTSAIWRDVWCRRHTVCSLLRVLRFETLFGKD